MLLENFALDKIVILFVMDTMEIPLSMDTLQEICVSNNWVTYMDFRQCIYDLLDSTFVVSLKKGSDRYILSADGKKCLQHFFTEIPLSKRDEIKAVIRENCVNYRRKQDYVSDYFRNNDGSYTVIMRINSNSADPLMELKLLVQSKTTAKWLNKNWITKASVIYEMLNQHLIE